MIDKPKRKNDIVVSQYDETWYGRFYRRMNWDLTEEVIVNTSPEACLADMYPFATPRSHYLYTIETGAEKRPYWFVVHATIPASRESKSHTSHVFGSIVRHNENERESLITIRTYPFGFFFALFSTGLSIIVPGLPFYTLLAAVGGPAAALLMCLFLLITLLDGLERFYAIFTARQKNHTLMKNHFLSLNRQLAQKAALTPPSFTEEAHYEQQIKTQE